MKPPAHPMRGTGRMLLIGVVLVLAIVTPAHAAGTGLGFSVADEGPRRVVGSGSWAIAGEQSAQVAFECRVVSSPDPVSTAVESVDGCVLKRNGVIVARALGRTMPGAVAATSDLAAVDLYGIESLEVCWRGHASFSDGSLLTTADCSNVSVLDTSPSTPRGVTVSAASAPVPLELCGGEDCEHVVFACTAVGYIDAVAVEITDCEIRKSGDTIARAGSVTFPGPAAVTSSSATLFPDRSDAEICWRARASYTDGSRIMTQGCSSL